jgi:hypothetical protein
VANNIYRCDTSAVPRERQKGGFSEETARLKAFTSSSYGAPLNLLHHSLNNSYLGGKGALFHNRLTAKHKSEDATLCLEPPSRGF